MSEIACTVAALRVHPVKSCAGIECRDALVTETGLDLDRAWMVVDAEGRFVSQRVLPRMALVRPTLKASELVLRAPGMLGLHVSIDAVEAPAKVRVWSSDVDAWDLGDLAAQWFSDFLGRPGLRLARFDPEQRRLADPAWTGAVEAPVMFADGFPLLVCGAASLRALNERLAGRGAAPVGIDRFRPNVVLDGLEPFDEDHVDTVEIDADGGPVVLKLVKPCVRCSVPDVDPATGEGGAEPGATLATFRADPRMQGGITFGMNAIVVDGFDRTLEVGRGAVARLAFG